MSFETLKQNYVNGLLETNAFLIRSVHETPFTLRSGKQSYMFLDHSRIANSAKAYKAFIDVVAERVQEVYGEREITLCNVDSKISAQMVGSMAYLLNKPQIVYKSIELTKVEKGTQNQLTGNLDWELPVAILDDVMTGGDGTAKNVGDKIQEAFSKVKEICIFVGFTRDIKKNTYPTHHVLTQAELLAIVWDELTSEQRQAIEKERSTK